MTAHSPGFTVFRDMRRIASGSLADAAIAYQQATMADPNAAVFIFDDLHGDTRDVDVRGTAVDIRARYGTPAPAAPAGEAAPARTRGRPKLGVVSREVTLLPRHWEWLAGQPGGASVALRKLVDEARRRHAGRDLQRRAQERAYRFMSTIAGDLPGFEEASRALFANDLEALGSRMAGWPDDVRAHVLRLASPDDLVDAPA
ncbi:DUF2239 family protein [Pandoraea nosoerga]|uniref:DUF2239 domain-containing protein n=1 Tax=Pandoraea nosoerga TaxID=2508296 RepID=A0A5E4SSN2_9BURK|nr:DUF2239 family protein [Pandoraea nosoerga]MBN4666422.1 DUF2239 family protein [Pandoraea nosoerga]MBN4677633.1 DUF2239 family protein [Pandoraea nosoerga]MBN4682555.1 DUF2239 family protein [Pandoraea nosoerga]MBN4745582.1 DUF2239 family protein [Pandoraea nosoerga]VVD77853.1 hypothetical protein PNO31109_00929 [Pandoraea nosoerga]